MATFADLHINNNILKSLTHLGFQKPTPIQEKVIPLMLEQKVDLVSLAQTGTGKTAAFGLPLVQLTDTASRKTQSLILCPTRELCVQVAGDLETFCRHIENLNILAIYGGSSIERQITALRRGIQLIVATPGRLNDLINRRKVDISEVRYVVFDEADEMLQMGFQDELNAILARTPPEKNTLLFSATMSKEVADIAGNYMSDPIEITIGSRNAGAENVCHEYYTVHGGNRYPALKRIVDNHPDIYAIIFCRTRQETGDIAAKLIQNGYSAEALHGDLNQAQRDQVMKRFRGGDLQLLVATDVAARGLDVNELTHVINYHLPDDPAGYTHRSGRTGRAGRTGISASIVQPKEEYKIRQIEKKIKKKFTQRLIPSGEEVCRRQATSLARLIAGLEVDYDQLEPLCANIAKELESLDREELIKRFVSLELKKLLEGYKDVSDLNAAKRPTKQSGRHLSRLGKSGNQENSCRTFTRLSLNIGRRDGVMPQGLISKINEVPGVGRIKIGRIDINRNSSYLEADSRYVPQIIAAFQSKEINGKQVSIEVNREKGGAGPPIRRSRGHRKGRGFQSV